MVKIGQSQTKHLALNNLTNESKPTSHVYFGFSLLLFSRAFCRWYEQCETFQCELLKSFGCQCRGASTYDFYRFMVLVRREDKKYVRLLLFVCFWLYIHGKYLCCLWHPNAYVCSLAFSSMPGISLPVQNLTYSLMLMEKHARNVRDKFAYLDANEMRKKRREKRIKVSSIKQTWN